MTKNMEVKTAQSMSGLHQACRGVKRFKPGLRQGNDKKHQKTHQVVTVWSWQVWQNWPSGLQLIFFLAIPMGLLFAEQTAKTNCRLPCFSGNQFSCWVKKSIWQRTFETTDIGHLLQVCCLEKLDSWDSSPGTPALTVIPGPFEILVVVIVRGICPDPTELLIDMAHHHFGSCIRPRQLFVCSEFTLSSGTSHWNSEPWNLERRQTAK